MSFTLAMDGGKAHTSEIDGAAVWKLLGQSMGLIGELIVTGVLEEKTFRSGRHWNTKNEKSKRPTQPTAWDQHHNYLLLLLAAPSLLVSTLP